MKFPKVICYRETDNTLEGKIKQTFRELPSTSLFPDQLSAAL